MIALGLRLAVSGGREAVARLVAWSSRSALGIGLLLATLAMTNAVGAWNNRHAWFWTGTSRLPAAAPAPGVAPLWWQTSRDLYDGQDDQPLRPGRHRPHVTGAAGPAPRPGTGASTTPRPRWRR